MHFAHAGALNDRHHVVRTYTACCSDRAFFARVLHQGSQHFLTIHRTRSSSGGEYPIHTDLNATGQHFQRIRSMINGPVKGDLAFGCQLFHGAHQLTVHRIGFGQPTSDQSDGPSSVDLGIGEQCMQGWRVVQEACGRRPHEHPRWKAHRRTYRIHEAGARGDAPTGQPATDLHTIGTSPFRGNGFFHRCHAHLNTHLHGTENRSRTVQPVRSVHVQRAMSYRWSLLLAAVLTVLVFIPPPCLATAAEDSVHAVVDGAVSANQRSQALVAAAFRVMDSEPVEAHRHAVSALAFAEQSGDPLVEHKALACLGKAEERVGLFADFMKTTLRAVQLAQSLGDPKMIALDLRELAEAYRVNAMSDKAVEEARNALAMTLPTQTGAAVDEAHRFLIRTLLLSGKHAEALSSAERCLNNAREKGDLMEEARLSRLIGATLLEQRRFSDANTYLTRAERGLESAGTTAERFEIQSDLAQCHIGLGRYKEATATLQRAGETLRETDTWNNRYRYIELQYQLAVAQGRWQEALVLLKRIKERSDSVNMARLDMQMARMQMTFQLDRKEKANAQLRTENAKSAEIIAGEQLNNRVLVGIVILFSVLAVALFFTSRHSLRMARRVTLKNAVIKKQHDEIHAKNLELQRQNLRLAETLMSEEEKEMMIKEIHHRVKNNLQVVDSLLQIQCIDSDDPGVDKVLREAQGRIRSMALVHEHIYRSAGGVQGRLDQHIQQLVRNILVAHGAHDRISVSVDAPLPSFHTDTLMPLTLVINELFTNAVKYAFRNKNSGRVTITVRPAGHGHELLFSDDGAGMEADDSSLRERSFGLELVRMLAEQLNGEVRFLKGAGTTVCLTFAPDRVALRAAS